MSTMISVENVSKRYRLGLLGGRTLYEDVNRWWARVRKQPDPHLKIGQEHLAERMGEEFWALKDVSFEVKQGEVLGIIGRNGAGKSTLLKILSRVTAPTEGRIRLAGRVASLLEVGTGFHPELTGRENTYLNGAILGMTKREIDRKFDEIVAFSEVEQFIDTPVKRYSSGMYVRLAFAVAAHLDPEILIVDEVLAVGDAAFQKKCLGKMGDVARGGRTVLFVSHNMAAVESLCGSALVLHQGLLVGVDAPRRAIAGYLRRGATLRSSTRPEVRCSSRNASSLELLAVSVGGDGSHFDEALALGQPWSVLITLKSRSITRIQHLSLTVMDSVGLPIYHCVSADSLSGGIDIVSTSSVRVNMGVMSLYPDMYSISVWIGDQGGHLLSSDRCVMFTVVQGSEGPERELLRSRGVHHLSPEWSVVRGPM